jgi:hypothetical protein
MKIHTDVTTLSRLYPIFKEAGIEGVLTGDFSKIEGFGYQEIFGALLQAGNIPEVCKVITRCDTCLPPYSSEEKPWEDCSREESMGLIISFFLDIIGLHNESQDLLNQLKSLKQTSL